MKGDLKAIYIGRFVVELLKRHSVKGKVISFFKNTLNIEVPDYHLITITSKRFPAENNIVIEPFSLRIGLDGFRDLVNFRANAELLLIKNSILVKVENKKFTIELNDSRVFKRSLPNLSLTSWDNIRICLLRGLNTFIKLAFILSKQPSKKVLGAILDSSSHLFSKTYCFEKSKCELPKEVLRYIGLGYGFTPEYDDYIAGFLGTANFLSSVINNGPIFTLNPAEILERTNRTSALIILESSRGIISEPIMGLIKSLLSCDLSGFLNYLIDLLTIGHNSGVNIGIGSLMGILYVLRSMSIIKGSEINSALISLLKTKKHF